MFLDVGKHPRIDEPTAERVAAGFHDLPADARFLILHADEEHFIQATPVGDSWRVEWRQESRQRFMLVGLQQAQEAFFAYLRWDEPALKSFPWKRLTLFNDPFRRAIFLALALLVVALLSVWFELRHAYQ
jgi:hypothetical protein